MDNFHFVSYSSVDAASFASELYDAPRTSRRRLRQVIVDKYSLAQFEILCADIEEDLHDAGVALSINLSELGGDKLANRVLNLIEDLDKRGYLHILLAAVRRDYPGSI